MHVGEVFQWNQVAFFIREETELAVRASYKEGYKMM